MTVSLCGGGVVGGPPTMVTKSSLFLICCSASSNSRSLNCISRFFFPFSFFFFAMPYLCSESVCSFQVIYTGRILRWDQNVTPVQVPEPQAPM